ncbi:hypothetical protein PINS_up001866 [Pythium insidiosum]|nr:hypothetical protein PINS_up001866 [Pythium insidiosum]
MARRSRHRVASAAPLCTRLRRSSTTHRMTTTSTSSSASAKRRRRSSSLGSEVRILEVLDDVCDRLPLQLPDTTPKKRKALNAACTSFVGEFEDELINVFFNNFEPAKHRMCSATLDVCPRSAGKDEL